MKLNFVKKEYNVNAVDVEYVQRYLPMRELAEKLVASGVTAKNADGYFNAFEQTPYDPFLMKGMKEAVEMLGNAAYQSAEVLIYGDYDADGVSAAAILKLFFDGEDIPCRVRLPLRDEGYGLHAEVIESEFKEKPFSLLITVDCGISNADEIEKIKRNLGVEIIVTDHHELPEKLPDCICVNPKMGYPFPYLSGAGVALKLVEAMSNTETAFSYADLAAVGTLGDMMPITDENRIIVKYALSGIKHKSLKALCKSAKCGAKLGVPDFCMKVCPRINAAGRVDTPEKALAVLLEPYEENKQDLEELTRLNELRKAMVGIATEQAIAYLEKDKRERKVIIIENDEWHTGILGIIAARIKDKYNKPVFVFGKRNKSYIGSGRGSQVNMFEALKAVSGCLEHFGGHENSVGLSVSCERFDEFRINAERYFDGLDGLNADADIYYDLEYDKSKTLAEIGALLEKFEPCYPSDKPIFHTVGNIEGIRYMRDGTHIVITLDGGFQLTGFNEYLGSEVYLKQGVRIEVLFTIELNSYSGGFQSIIKELRVLNSLRLEEIYCEIFLRNAQPSERKYVTEEECKELLNKDEITVGFGSFEEAELFMKGRENEFVDFALNFFVVKGKAKKNIVISPVKKDECELFVVSERGYDTMSKDTKVFCMELGYTPYLKRMGLNRDKCAEIFKKIVKSKARYMSAEEMYCGLEFGSVSFSEFLATLRVFGELGIFKLSKEPFGLSYMSEVKSELTKSKLYLMVRG